MPVKNWWMLEENPQHPERFYDRSAKWDGGDNKLHETANLMVLAIPSFMLP